jgi:response regulator NasT
MVKVLLADDNPARAGIIATQLAGAADFAFCQAQCDAVLDDVGRHSPDVVVMDLPFADRGRLAYIREVVTQHRRPVVMLIEADDPAFMEEAIDAGVSSYHVVGDTLPEFGPIIRSAAAIFRRTQRIERDLKEARTSLAERKTIDQAKGMLMQQLSIPEPKAYALLRRQSMDQGRRIVEIAEELLSRNPAMARSPA